MSATAAPAAIRPEVTVPYESVVHSRKPAATTMVTLPAFTASERARSRMSPSVFSDTKIKPWVKKSSRVVRPPSRAYGFNRSKKVPE